MRITIFNLLTEHQETTLTAIQETYLKEYPTATVGIENIPLDNLKDCIGCWSCWVKTPGLCIHKDSMSTTYSSLVKSDIVLFAMSTAKGFISGPCKTFIDRLIPLFHPYFRLDKGEMMHVKRYDEYPVMDVYYDDTILTEGESAILEDYFYRMLEHFQISGHRICLNQEEHRRILLADRSPKPDIHWDTLPPESSFGKVILYNGSPRGKGGNSLKIINQLAVGLKEAGVKEEDIIIRHLANQANHALWAKDFHNHSRHFFVFPLYVHAMPGIVKKFFDLLTPVKSDSIQMSFFVQSGFPEGFQSHYLRAWLARFPRTLNCLYGGILIKGGMEALQVKPDEANKKLYAQLNHLGQGYAKTGLMQAREVAILSSPEHLSLPVQLLFKFAFKIGIGNFYWAYRLKKNNAYDRRFDKPYM